MRKLAVFPMAGLLILAIAAPAAAGANVTNGSGTGSVINGEWSSDGVYGYAYLATDSTYGSWAEIYEESGEWIACDESDESYGFVGSRTYGWSEGITVTIDSRLNHGSASGTLEVATETVNECTGEYTSDGEPMTVAFSASVDGDGRAARFRNGGTYQLPGEVNAHSRQSGSERHATGTLDLGQAGSRELAEGVLATFSWKEHSNG
jgi:hypothetical protein